MARNRSVKYIRNLFKIETKNGYKVDVQNYLYNPSYSYEYPNLFKILEETEEYQIVKKVRFFKTYYKSCYYEVETYTMPKSKESSWGIAQNVKAIQFDLESQRFSMPKLIAFAETLD